MGTIIERTRKDGSKSFTAQILLKRGGKIAHREAKTFERKQAALSWMVRREDELTAPGGLDLREDPPLARVITRYENEAKVPPGSTKAGVLKKVKESEIGELKCRELKSDKLVSFAQSLSKDRQPQTIGNYFSHLSPIFEIARPGWKYPLDERQFEDAVTVLKRLGLIKKGNQRDRRPTLEEPDRLMEYFGRYRDDSCPMRKITAFAMFSTRRQEEITLLKWDDLDGDRILIRDMKDPKKKQGNNVFCELTPEALAIINCADAQLEPEFESYEPVLVEVPNPGHPFGAKGVAEVNICPPMAAIANAIARAVGRRLTELPMSPPKVLAAIDAREQA